MSGPVMPSRGGRIILFAYNNGTTSISSTSISPILTETIDVYSAFTGTVYDFPKNMRVRVSASASIYSGTAGANGLLYFTLSGTPATVFPITYKDTQVVAGNNYTAQCNLNFVHDFVAGNRISLTVQNISGGTAQLLGGAVGYVQLTLEEYAL